MPSYVDFFQHLPEKADFDSGKHTPKPSHLPSEEKIVANINAKSGRELIEYLKATYGSKYENYLPFDLNTIENINTDKMLPLLNYTRNAVYASLEGKSLAKQGTLIESFLGGISGKHCLDFQKNTLLTFPQNLKPIFEALIGEEPQIGMISRSVELIAQNLLEAHEDGKLELFQDEYAHLETQFAEAQQFGQYYDAVRAKAVIKPETYRPHRFRFQSTDQSLNIYGTFDDQGHLTDPNVELAKMQGRTMPQPVPSHRHATASSYVNAGASPGPPQPRGKFDPAAVGTCAKNTKNTGSASSILRAAGAGSLQDRAAHTPLIPPNRRITPSPLESEVVNGSWCCDVPFLRGLGARLANRSHSRR